MGATASLLSRELRLAFRQSSDTVIVVGFFLIVVALFPLGLGPDPKRIAEIGPAIVWVAALLAILLGLDRLFEADRRDGTLDLLMTGPPGPLPVVLTKLLALWLTAGLPLALLSPLIAIMLGLSLDVGLRLFFALLIGTPTLTLIGGIGAALVLGARRGGVLLTLVVLPLYVPILIFGVSAVAPATGMTARPAFLFLGAMLLAALPLAPWATVAALKQTTADG